MVALALCRPLVLEFTRRLFIGFVCLIIAWFNGGLRMLEHKLSMETLLTRLRYVCMYILNYMKNVSCALYTSRHMEKETDRKERNANFTRDNKEKYFLFS